MRSSGAVATAAKVVPLALPAAANLVVIPPIRGTGDEALGTFTPAGRVYIDWSCNGKGPITIVGEAGSSSCEGGAGSAEVQIPGLIGKPLHLTVHAEPGTTWWLAVGEHIPGTTLVLVHRTGAGNKSLGTFPLRGKIQIAMNCDGVGNFDVAVASLSSPPKTPAAPPPAPRGPPS